MARYAFIEPPKDDLKCQVCKKVAAEPFQHAKCGKLFCSACLESRDRPCSHCGGSKGFFKDEKSKKDINGLLVRCLNSFGGNSCQWRGVYSDLKSHNKNCHFLASAPCPSQLDGSSHGNAVKSACGTSFPNQHPELHSANREHTCPQCGEVMKFGEYAAHAQRSCPARDYQCPHCSKVMPFNKYPAHKTSCLNEQHYQCLYCDKSMKISEQAAHDNTCPKKPVECPNAHAGCSGKVQRRNVKKHLLSCGYVEVACKYAEIGCSTRMPRADIHAHERNEELHFSMVLSKLMELSTGQKKSNSHVTLFSGGSMTFKLSNYQRHKENQETFTSPEFSTPSGHSMAVKVQFSGNQISLSTKTIRSPTITDPPSGRESEAFNGIITIRVLNQLKDDDHLAKSGVQNATKFGVAYTKIQSTNLDVQYLKEDALYFRATIDTPKPWLECTEI